MRVLIQIMNLKYRARIRKLYSLFEGKTFLLPLDRYRSWPTIEVHIMLACCTRNAGKNFEARNSMIYI
jgi:hypothetical protein